MRTLCRQHQIMYQAFSLLTANVAVLHHPKVGSIAARLGVQPTQVIFRFAIQLGMVPLTGTTREKHMREDLAISNLELTPEEVSLLESIEG